MTDFISASIDTKLVQKDGGLRKEPLKALPIEFRGWRKGRHQPCEAFVELLR